MNNPCNICIVQSMCEKKCDILLKSIRAFLDIIVGEGIIRDRWIQAAADSIIKTKRRRDTVYTSFRITFRNLFSPNKASRIPNYWISIEDGEIVEISAQKANNSTWIVWDNCNYHGITV